MNKLILLAFLLITFISFSQDYDAKIQELNQQMEAAVSNEEFDKASTLKKERDLYVELKEAIKNEDFQKASKIKAVLSGETISVESNSNTNIPESCIVYFFAGKSVGPVGGYVSTADIENVNLRSGEIKKVKINSGTRTFITNWSEKKTEVTRNLEPGKIYFIEFNSYMGNGLERPTLRFVNQSTFLSLTNFSEKLPKEYVVQDTDILENESILNFTSNLNCKRCHLEINGIRVLSSFKKKSTYSIGVPADEVVVTLICELFEDWVNFNIVTLECSNNQYLEAKFKKIGLGVQQVELNEVSREDFKNNTDDYNSIIINK